MKRFLLGIALGAAAIYAASKLVDKDTKEDLCEDLDRAADDIKRNVKSGLKTGRGKAMRAGVHVRQEVRAGKKKISKATGDLAEKLTEDLNQLEEKLRKRTNDANS